MESTGTTSADGIEIRASRREWAGLAVLAIPTLLIWIDVFVLLLALRNRAYTGR